MKHIGALTAILLLSGCATCNVASFYKPFPSQESAAQTYSQSPGKVGFDIEQKAFVTVSVCGDRYLPSPGNALTICLAVELAKESAMQFADASVTVVTADGRGQAVPLSAIEYEVFCRVNEIGRKICSSSEQPPVDGPVAKRIISDQLDRYYFEPTLRFQGAADTLHEGSYLGYRPAGRRRYMVRTTVLPIAQGTDITVRLPSIRLDGRTHDVPAIPFRAVTEEVCRIIPLA